MIIRNRPIRRSQLISPFGVGAITDFRNDEALMCAGIDSWFQGEPPVDLRISEERLFYCQQCGIDPQEAVSLIVGGFCQDVIDELPMEFALEAKALLAVSLEGAVG